MNEDSKAVAAVVQAEQALAAAHLTRDIATIDHFLHPAYSACTAGWCPGNQGPDPGLPTK